MARTDTLGHFLTDVADAIREKKGTEETITASDFDTEIENLPSGGDLSEYFTSTIGAGQAINYNNFPGWFFTIKKIPDTINIIGNSLYRAFWYFQGTELPNLNTSNVTNFEQTYSNCPNVINFPAIDLSSTTYLSSTYLNCTSMVTAPQLLNSNNLVGLGNTFQGCSNLINVPVYDFSGVVSANMISYVFMDCPNLSNESLNNIMQICINMTSYVGTKTLKFVMGLSEEQATICQSLSNYQDFIDAGWTTGY